MISSKRIAILGLLWHQLKSIHILLRHFLVFGSMKKGVITGWLPGYYLVVSAWLILRHTNVKIWKSVYINIKTHYYSNKYYAKSIHPYKSYEKNVIFDFFAKIKMAIWGELENFEDFWQNSSNKFACSKTFPYLCKLFCTRAHVYARAYRMIVYETQASTNLGRSTSSQCIDHTWAIKQQRKQITIYTSWNTNIPDC